MSKGRVEGFSDAVIAVAITLLALDIRVPPTYSHATLAHSLGAEWPEYAAYVVSFLTIGIIWINHHAMLRRLVKVDHTILVLNIVLLMTIGFLPFTTALMAQYLKAATGEHLAAAIFGGSFLLMASTFMTLQRHLLLRKTHLLEERLTPPVRRAVLRRNTAGILPYVVATIGAIISPYVTLGICAAVAIFYALPATTSDA